MIQMLLPLACGNAVSILLEPDVGASAWLLLRNTTGTFTGYDDTGAVTVATGSEPEAVVDYQALLNGVPYFYQLYCLQDSTWEASGDPETVTPAYQSQLQFQSPDIGGLLRERLALGLQAELSLGRISHVSGVLPVFAAPPLIDQTQLPIVTVMLENRRSDVRGIGEYVIPDTFEEDLWSCFEGWLDRSDYQIIVWALNPDDRIRLRNAVQRVLMLNLSLFDIAGAALIDIAEADSADYASFNAPVYQTIFTWSCSHPALVRDRVSPIRHVETYPDGERSNPDSFY